MRNHQAQLLLAVPFRQSHHLCHSLVDHRSFWVALRVLGYQNDHFHLWYIVRRHFWHHLYRWKLCQLYLRVWRVWYCRFCHMFISPYGHIVWNCFVDTTKAWVCQHRTVGSIHFLAFASKQRFVSDRRPSSILHYSWCGQFHHGSNCLNETEKLHHLEHILHQCILARKTFGVLPSLLPEWVPIGKLLFAEWLHQLAILLVFD